MLPLKTTRVYTQGRRFMCAFSLKSLCIRGHTQGRSPLCACCVGEVLVKSQPSLSTRGFTEGIKLTCAGTVAKTLGRNHTSGHLQVRSLLCTGSEGGGLVTRQSSTHTRGHTQERSLMSASMWARLQPSFSGYFCLSMACANICFLKFSI